MAGLERYNAKAVVQRVGNDTVYGGGQDGTVVVSTNTSLTRDMYYNNLTINSGIHLNTNGWKVFVKGTLTLTGTIGIKSTDGAVSGTSLAGHTAANTAVTYSIGGSTQTHTATQLPMSLFHDIDKAISGYYVDSAATARVIQGGAGGPTGAAGTLDTNVAAPTTWTGKAGAGGAGGSGGAAGALGQHPPAAHTVGSPGGRGGTGGTGSTGGTGTDGTAGTAGTSGTAGTGGTGGNGGAIVLIAAKTVIGSGTIFSQGKTGASGGLATAGSAGSAGSAGTDGATGAAGGTGHTAPGQDYAAHANNYHHTRPAWHGGGDTHTTHLPHFHNPHYHTHGYKHTDHYIVWTGHAALGAPPHAHSHNPTHNAAAIPADHFSHRGGVNHNHYHTHNPTGGTHGGFAHMYDHGHHGHNDPGTHQNTKFNHEHFGHRYHQVATAWSAGPALHSFHYHATKPGGAGGGGGAGGAGGAKGLAGPGGRAGTPTDGTAGAPGGGGGFILVTETTPSSVVYNTSGTTSGGYTSSNGMQIVVLNA